MVLRQLDTFGLKKGKNVNIALSSYKNLLY